MVACLAKPSKRLYYRPNPGGQAAFMLDLRHRYIELVGGWASGKTWAGARKLLWLHLVNAQRGKYRIPSACIAPTYRNAKDFVAPELRLACEEIKLPVRWVAQDSQFVFPGMRLAPIMVRTADAPERITGWQVGAAWGDEPARWKADQSDPRLDPLLQLKGRVRHPQAKYLQCLFTGTPEGDHTRIYEEFHGGLEDHASYRVPTTENPHMARFAAEQRRGLSDSLAKQYLDGIAIQVRGMAAYGAFEHNVHVSTAAVIHAHEVLALAVDFNISPGMHALLGRYSDDMFVISHLVHGPRMNVNQMVEQVIRILGEEKFGNVRLEVFGDATGKSQWAGTSDSCYEVLSSALSHYGIPHRLRIPRSNPPVVDRVNATNVALCDVEGKSHVLIHPRCEQLINDLQRVRLDDRGGIDKSNPRLSHASDALGYWVHYVRPIRRIEIDPAEARVIA